MNDYFVSLATFADLAQQTLGAPLVTLENNLKPSFTIGWVSLPAPVSASYESLLFGGSLLSCEIGRIYEFTEAFHTCFAALALPDNAGYAVLGPYLRDRAGGISVEQLLAENGVAPGNQIAYVDMYENLPLLGEDKIRSFFNCLYITVFNTQLSPGPFSAVDLGTAPAPCPVYGEDKLQAQAEMLDHRYRQERIMLDAVARGDFEALGIFLNASINLIRTPNKLRNDKNLLIVLNTLMRKAIESAQVHPLYIDRISTQYAVRIEQLTSRDSIIAFRHEMVRGYCDLVRSRSLLKYSPHVRDALNYIQFNLTEPLTLTAISQKINVNPTYLSTQFNRELGTSLTDYIADKRIEESKAYLRAGSFTISQIAVMVGFSDINYFSRIFKQKNGCTPSEFRADNQIR